MASQLHVLYVSEQINGIAQLSHTNEFAAYKIIKIKNRGWLNKNVIKNL